MCQTLSSFAWGDELGLRSCLRRRDEGEREQVLVATTLICIPSLPAESWNKGVSGGRFRV